MHSTALLSVLAAAATLTAAAPSAPPKRAVECPELDGKTQLFYVCASNGFRGFCSSNACSQKWCPDYVEDTCTPTVGPADTPSEDPATTTSSVMTPTPVPVGCPKLDGKTQQFYVCAGNGFKGFCSSDACAQEWCPDYEVATCTPKKAPCSKETCIEKPLCSGKEGACPGKADPNPAQPKTYYQCYNNGFNGHCSVDPCAIAWCPDYELKTYNPIVYEDKTVCREDTGYFQSCYNGYRGCCKKDACSTTLGYCPN